MKNGWIRALLWMAVLMTMLMIFGFSEQTGEASLGMSHAMVQPVVDWVASICPSAAPEFLDSLYWNLQTLVRKGAHVAEYAWLGFLIRLLSESYAWPRPGLCTWLAGTLYAASDEIHQMYITARSPQLSDVVIDSLGVGLGAVLAAFCLKRFAGRFIHDYH